MIDSKQLLAAIKDEYKAENERENLINILTGVLIGMTVLSAASIALQVLIA